MANQLTPLQKRLLEMMNWFHNFCIENDIKYYAMGGTMLGAARHKGFIPWDDDIDVGLLRRDYEKLRKLSKEVSNCKYVFEFPDSDDESFATPYAKLYDSGTTLIENYRRQYKRGIFIDIFPIDGVGNNIVSSRIEFIKQKALYNFFMTRVACLSDKRSNYKNIAIICSRLIPNFFVSNKKLRIYMDSQAAKKDIKKYCYGGNIFGNWGYKEIMSSEIFDDPEEYAFNGITIFGFRNYDEYLSNMYGDWRTVPPIEKQITHHDFYYLNLDEPYLKNSCGG